MTKTLLTILVTCYALARMVIIAGFYYVGEMRLPNSVAVATIVCSVVSLSAAYNCYMRQKSGKQLRFALFVCAIVAVYNMIVTLLAQPGTLTTLELLVTGTVFDVMLVAASCTIKIRDNRGNQTKNPFTRMAHSEHADS